MNKIEETRILKRFDGLKLGWFRDTLFFVAAVAVFIVMFRFVIGLSIVGGASMDPTLKDGEIVVYSRLARNYTVGDVVAMRVPAGEFYIKRIVATGRQIVDIHNEKLHVYGREAADEHAFGSTKEETGAVILDIGLCST